MGISDLLAQDMTLMTGAGLTFCQGLDRVGPGGRLDRYEAVNCYSYSQSTSIVSFS